MTIQKRTWMTRVREICDPRYLLLQRNAIRKRFARKLRKLASLRQKALHASGAATIGAAAFLSSFAAIPVQEANAGLITTIDFETPDVTNTQTIAAPYGEDGFTLITNASVNGFVFVETDSLFYTGSQAAHIVDSNADVTITIDDANSVFTPLSIDLAEFFGVVGGYDIVFTGITASNTIINDTLTVDGIGGFGAPGTTETLSFNITQPLKSLTFNTSTNGIIFDNIVLDVVAIPEPSTLLLGAMGLGGVLVSRRRDDSFKSTNITP